MNILASILGTNAATASAGLASDAVAVFNSLKGLLPRSTTQTPITQAEVALAKVVQKDLPSVTADDLAHIKTAAGAAVAIYLTEHSQADLTGNSAASQANLAEICTMLDHAIDALGFDPSKLRTIARQDLVAGAVLLSQAGLGLKSLSLTASSIMGTASN